MAIKLMMLTQWFDPEPAMKDLAFAREMVKHGFEVDVVTGFPNYPGGKLYPGYKLKLIQRELVDGIRITRLPLYPNHDNSGLKRAINFISFAISSFFYCLFQSKKTDVMYVYGPPVTLGLVALIIRFFRKTRVVLDVQDMWPDSLSAVGMLHNNKLLKMCGAICNWVYKRVDKILVLSPGFKRLLIERGVNGDKIEIVYNWCNEDVLLESVATNLVLASKIQNKFCIMFAGNIGPAQGLDTIIQVAEKLNDLQSNSCFVFLGSGAAYDDIKLEIETKKISNIICLPHVPRNEVKSYLDQADVLLVHLKNNPLFTITIPSKTQAYMAMGKPIIMAVQGDAANLVRQAGCGMHAVPDNVDDIVRIVLEFESMNQLERESIGKKGSEYYFENLSFSVGAEKIASEFCAVMEP